MIITFEGIDGSGKSTLCFMLKKYLCKLGYTTTILKEPTHFITGKFLKKFLHRYGKKYNNRYIGRCIACLFAADRYYHQLYLKRCIKKYDIIILDRYYHSFLVYQRLYKGCSIHWLKNLCKDIILPDITFIIDVAPKEALNRIYNSRPQKEVYEELKILTKIRKFYLELPKIINFQKEKIYIINGEKDLEKVFEDVLKILRLYFNT